MSHLSRFGLGWRTWIACLQVCGLTAPPSRWPVGGMLWWSDDWSPLLWLLFASSLQWSICLGRSLVSVVRRGGVAPRLRRNLPPVVHLREVGLRLRPISSRSRLLLRYSGSPLGMSEKVRECPCQPWPMVFRLASSGWLTWGWLQLQRYNILRKEPVLFSKINFFMNVSLQL